MNKPYTFRFNNDQRRDNAAIVSAFKENGMDVALIEREGMVDFWVWVLTTDANLYLLDLSHGGGGYFSLYKE